MNAECRNCSEIERRQGEHAQNFTREVARPPALTLVQ